MNSLDIRSDLKELLKKALAKKDFKKVVSILSKISSFVSEDSNEDIDAILFKDVIRIVKSKEDLENILLSTKVAFKNKEEVIEFFKMLIDYDFKESAFDYFEEFLVHLNNDVEIIDGFNSILKK